MSFAEPARRKASEEGKTIVRQPLSRITRSKLPRRWKILKEKSKRFTFASPKAKTARLSRRSQTL